MCTYLPLSQCGVLAGFPCWAAAGAAAHLEQPVQAAICLPENVQRNSRQAGIADVCLPNLVEEAAKQTC
jgi:hypothetical protein